MYKLCKIYRKLKTFLNLCHEKISTLQKPERDISKQQKTRIGKIRHATGHICNTFFKCILKSRDFVRSILRIVTIHRPCNFFPLFLPCKLFLRYFYGPCINLFWYISLCSLTASVRIREWQLFFKCTSKHILCKLVWVCFKCAQIEAWIFRMQELKRRTEMNCRRRRSS